MSGFEVDASELVTLAHWLNQAPPRLEKLAGEVTKTAGQQHARDWRAAARRTSGRHGRLYPSTISSSFRSGPGFAESDTGPVSSRPQGGMGRGFEYGSKNQQPHLDGTKTFDKAEDAFVKAGEDAIAKALGEL